MRNQMIRSEKYRKYGKFSQFRETRNQNLEYIFAILQNMNDFFKDKKNYTELYIFAFGTRSSNLLYTVQYVDFDNCSFVPKKVLLS